MVRHCQESLNNFCFLKRFVSRFLWSVEFACCVVADECRAVQCRGTSARLWVVAGFSKRGTRQWVTEKSVACPQGNPEVLCDGMVFTS